MDKHNLPFEVGQLVETRSFLEGYRGAWFKCKIHCIRLKSCELSLEYCDFPDEKIVWTKVYEKLPPTLGRKPKGETKELMVRPSFPRVFRQSEIPDSYPLSEVVVIVREIWKVGDMVDGLCDDAYWSGRVTDILGDEKVRIALAPPPLGEGSSFEALYKDMRPSLNWNPDDGWTVPPAMACDKSNCAWIMKPANHGGSSNFAVPALTKGRKKLNSVAGVRKDHKLPNPSCPLASSLPPKTSAGQQPSERSLAPKEILTPVMREKTDVEVKTSVGASFDRSLSPLRVSEGSLPHKRGVNRSLGAAEGNRSLKRRKVECGISFDRIHPETIEAAIVEMEEQKDHKLPNPSCPLASLLPPQPSPGQKQHSEPSLSTIKEIPALVVQAKTENGVEIKAEALVDNSLPPLCVSEGSLTPHGEVNRSLGASESKRGKVEGIPFSCIHPGTIEAAIVEMEELLNRVKWTKHILEVGMPSNTVGPSWEFVEHRALSTPK